MGPFLYIKSPRIRIYCDNIEFCFFQNVCPQTISCSAINNFMTMHTINDIKAG